MTKILICYLLLLCWYSNIGQTDGTLSQDKILDSNKVVAKKKAKDSLSLLLNNKPKRAFLLGALIPGAGQVFNKDWIKLPFVAGGYTALAYNFNIKQNRFKEFNSFYSEALACKCKVTIREYPTYKLEWDARQIKQYRDQFRDNRDVAIFLGIGVHLIIALEAYVHAHLKDFNIDQDLSFKLNAGQGSLGLAYTLH